MPDIKMIRTDTLDRAATGAGCYYFVYIFLFALTVVYLRGPFEKFVDPPYHSESELFGGTVTVSFSKYFPWQAMHFLKRSTHFSKMCCRPFAVSFRRIVEQAVLTFHVCFSVSKALPPLENRSLSHCIVSVGLMDDL
jgi:hypothetical protein